jgi:hypothetical protein
MKWLIVTCDYSEHIRPVQEWLFKKYAPKAEVKYLDLANNQFRLNKWGQDLVRLIPDDPFVIFGLDDYLPTGPLNEDKILDALGIVGMFDLDRFELGYGAHNKQPFMKGGGSPFVDHGLWLAYGTATPYSVSCQFSIWKTEALKYALQHSTNPWNFETKHTCWAGCFPKGEEAFRWIEESALSKKWEGKINVNGLPESDVRELIALELLDASKLINRG